jgi:phytoene desaturase
MKKVTIIGAGFSGLAAAASLAQAGFDVSVFEQHAIPGGRARKFESNGFSFDMGPSWYWMPDVFERFFGHFSKKPSDFYNLQRLDPSYRIYFGKKDYMDVPAGTEKLYRFFDELEPNGAEKLRRFLKEAQFKYDLGINRLVYKPGLNLTELIDWTAISSLPRLHVFTSVSSYVRKYFTNPRIIQLLEFPVLFLGSSPDNTPALYTLMNFADMALGTWYPVGGMYKVIEGMEHLAKDQGAKFHYNSRVSKINIHNKRAESISSPKEFSCDYLVASSDYHHTEQELLPLQNQKYSSSYWDKRVMAPSSLIFYIGLNKQLKGLLHHTLFFDTDFSQHASEIYQTPKWPTSPQFYVSCPSKTDSTVAPEGCENLMILMPVAAGLPDDEITRERYFKLILERLETQLDEKIEQHIIFKRSYAHKDFSHDYNAFKGNAYGLANTLTQTANWKPSMVNSKVKNMVYTGQLTVPGPGVPPAIISGQVAADIIIKKER